MKQWPDTGTVAYTDIIAEPTRILREAYNLKRTPKRKFDYQGYNIGQKEQACVIPPDEQLTPSTLAYHKEHGRDFLDVMLNIVFLLGMEQGRRDAESDIKTKLLLAEYEGYDRGLKKGGL